MIKKLVKLCIYPFQILSRMPEPNMISLKQSMQNFREEILWSSQETDLKIICHGRSIVHTSSLPMALSSKWFLTVIGDILGNSSRLDNEVVTLCLPDFSRAEFLKAFEFMSRGICYPDSTDEMLQIQILLDLLRVNVNETKAHLTTRVKMNEPEVVIECEPVIKTEYDPEMEVDMTEYDPLRRNDTEFKPTKKVRPSDWLCCNICQAEFKHRKGLLKHLARHNSTQELQCPECGKSYKTPGDLALHKRISHGGRKYECRQCGSQFSAKAKARLHTIVHTDVPLYQCAICSDEFRAEATGKKHVEKAHGLNGNGNINK